MNEQSMRLDQRLIAEGKASSREKAKELVQNGCVSVNGFCAKKAGQAVTEHDIITVSLAGFFAGDYESDEVFVSRGGHKLAKALACFGLSPEGCICLDAGASTGGFSDVLVRRGAEQVYAIDVGHGQFDEKLRKNEKIVVQEGINVRYLSSEDFPSKMDFVTADLSFISLTKVFPALSAVIRDGGTLVCLVKPQFEAGPGAVDKNGVIKDPAVRLEVLRNVSRSASANGFSVKGVTYSPILGPEGNIEFLLYAVKQPGSEADDKLLSDAVNESKKLEQRGK